MKKVVACTGLAVLVAAVVAAIVGYNHVRKSSLATEQVVQLSAVAADHANGAQNWDEAWGRITEALSKVPTDGRFFVKDASGNFLDAWGSQIMIALEESDGKYSVSATSDGPDRRAKTADDIKYSRTILIGPPQ